MKRMTVNGKAYEAHPLRAEDVLPGALICCRYVRKTYRIVVLDTGEWILRDLRHPHIVEVADEEWILANCDRMVPVP